MSAGGSVVSGGFPVVPEPPGRPGGVGGSLPLGRTTTTAASRRAPRKTKQGRNHRHAERKHMVSTPAKPGECKRCRRVVLAGHDEGLLATVDAEALDFAAEFAAVASGRATYALLGDGTLARRDAGRVAGGLVGRGIYAEHRCGRDDHEHPCPAPGMCIEGVECCICHRRGAP